MVACDLLELVEMSALRFRRALAAFLFALIAALTGVARNARACSPPTRGWFAYGGTREVPENGAVILRYSCATHCEEVPDPETMTLSSAEGEPVAGTVALTGEWNGARYVVFRPDAGVLVPGEAYQPAIPGVEYFDTITVVPAVIWSALPSVVEEFHPVDQGAGEKVCCSGPEDSCGEVPCFFTHYDREAAITIAWGDGESPEDHQYAFRVLRPNLGVVPNWSYEYWSTSYVLAPDETTTCYTLELKRLIDDAVLSYTERCVERPDDVAPGRYETSPEVVRRTLSGCDRAPTGYEQPWCEAYARNCAESG